MTSEEARSDRPAHPWVSAGVGRVRFAIGGGIPPFFGTPQQAIAHYQALADAGRQFFLFQINGRDEETVQLLADEVIPAIRGRSAH